MDGTQTSLSVCPDTLELFGECFSLKVNVEKSKAVWLHGLCFSNVALLPEKNLACCGTKKPKWHFQEECEPSV